jgi:cysteinyl-tRNA synthetase
LAAEEKIGLNDVKNVMPEFERMLEILQLSIPKITKDKKNEINRLVIERAQFRKEKKFGEADKIRDKLDEINIELIDHKEKTIWIRKEKIEGDH